MPKDSHGPQSSHEPAKPQFHVGNHQQVLPEVLPREMDLSFFWLTGILTAVTSPDEISRRKKKAKKGKEACVQDKGFGEIPEESTYARVGI